MNKRDLETIQQMVRLLVEMHRTNHGVPDSTILNEIIALRYVGLAVR